MFIYPIYNHNWRNISIIYIHNKTSIKRNILTSSKINREVGQAKDLSAPRYVHSVIIETLLTSLSVLGDMGVTELTAKVKIKINQIKGISCCRRYKNSRHYFSK